MIFPAYEVAIKIAIALGVGLLVGFERAWAHKETGVRTFSITALLGTPTAIVSIQFAVVSLIGVSVLIGYINGRCLLVERSLETTTSVALIVTFVLSVLIGQGHLFTPVASATLITMLLPGYGRPVGRFLRQRLNTGFLVVGHRDHPRLANLAAQQSFVENLYFLINMQYRHHLGLELRVPPLHIVSNLMRSKFSLHQDLMQLGAAHLLQFRVPRRPGLLPQVCGQQTVRPQLLGIAQLRGLLTGTVLHLCNRRIRNPTRLARTW